MPTVAIGSTLPLVSYLTRLDYFILLATILVFASLMEVMIVVRMARRREGLERARAIDRKCRWIFPGTFFVLGLAGWVGFTIATIQVEPEPAPEVLSTDAPTTAAESDSATGDTA